MTLNTAVNDLEQIVLYLAKQGIANTNPTIFDKAVRALNSVEDSLRSLDSVVMTTHSSVEPIYSAMNISNGTIIPQPYPRSEEPHELDV